MNEKQENGMIAIAVGVLFIIIALLAFTSCATKKKVVKELEYVHDTLHVWKTDTVRESNAAILSAMESIKKQFERIDSTMEKETTTITVNDRGDTIRMVNNFWHERVVIEKDSTSAYLAWMAELKASFFESRADSLQKILDQRHESEKVTVKTEPPWIERMIFLLAIGIFIYVFLKRK